MLSGRSLETSAFVDEFMAAVEARNPGEPEFLQAVREVVASVEPVLARHPRYRQARVLDRLVEPERSIEFRVAWRDDSGTVHVNRGFRIQFSSALGPYKGGLRFHPSVNRSILKFLGFEQTFKNSLTGLAMGGGKGGSDFDPKGRSDNEVMSFCQSFMTELFRHIGAQTDVPAGDIGVGGREIGFLYGQYKRLANEVSGVFTGKGVNWGGSLIRPEATGYGAAYLASAILEGRGTTLAGKTCLVSGAGNVAQYLVEKLTELGARVVTLSDSDGFIHDPEGITPAKLEWVQHLKNVRRGRLVEYPEEFLSARYTARDHAQPANPLWEVPADCAFPCATQNEINASDARSLVRNGVGMVVEGANMPTTPDAIEILMEGGALFAPGKASNAGGVAVSGLEMAQNSQRTAWPREEVDRRLRDIMQSIHRRCQACAEEYGTPGNLVNGANIAGFIKVADAMLDLGVL